ncbi:MAG TPA: sigma 54-interacting transcriptional regulator, partial [Myxococcota bacterium]|nr:sigma 54-interacting transcriptional regulator [Myxococcota bacterium]
ELMALAAGDEGVDDLLRRGLDSLARITDYELATIFVLQGNMLVARAARGPLASQEVRQHALSLNDFPTIREALDTRRARAYTHDDHAHGDGDPFDGVLDLPAGHSCMVVPLCAGERRFGVLTLDRTQCVPYPPEVVELVEVYSQILAIAIGNAEQKLALERLRRHEREHARLLEAQLGGEGQELAAPEASPAMRQTLMRGQQVARTDTPVLILGETGTGKERLARALHGWSGRSEFAFVSINCAAIPPTLLESELFGHVKGAFTGATRDRAGRFQMANGGTLLLDEVGELPIDVQAKLLRVLQEGTLEPVGSDQTVKVDVRILAATHVDLEAAIAAHRFRADLYYRLNVFPLHLPPLRERLDELPALCAALLAEGARRTGRRGVAVSDAALALLRRYRWPGNLRELGNVLERATILSPTPLLGPEVFDLPPTSHTPEPDSDRAPTGVLSLDEAQAEHIRRVLALTGGRIYGHAGAAKLLKIKPSTLQSRMKKLGIRTPR